MKATAGLILAAVVAAAPVGAQQRDTTHAKVVRSVATTRTGQKPAAAAATKRPLSSMAKISRDSARTIALSKVAAGSKVKSWELEREKGTVVYSFDVSVPKQSGVEEILVSAIDGSVISQTHETPKMERAEARKDKAQKKKP